MSTHLSISLENLLGWKFDLATPYNVIVCGNEEIQQKGGAPIELEKLMVDDYGDIEDSLSPAGFHCFLNQDDVFS